MTLCERIHDWCNIRTFSPWARYGTFGTKCNFFTVLHVDVCNDRRNWRTHCCTMKLLIDLPLERKETIIENCFKWLDYIIFRNESLGVNWSFDWSDQVAEPDNLQYLIPQAIPSNILSRTVCVCQFVCPEY